MSELITQQNPATQKTPAEQAIAPALPVRLCGRADLVAGSGVVAWHAGHQIALFYLPCRPLSCRPEDAEDADGLPRRPLSCRPETADRTDGADEPSRQPEAVAELYALDNRDPFSGANVIGRGIVGDLGGELVVASPIYKQHFRLRDGQCLEDPERRLRHWSVALDGNDVVLLPDEEKSHPD
ncbi:nitrite reductase (NAD(P)H) small subunit [Salinicola peritrichatus]|uniref:nitrite reductase (NAD(P)H) small subunit n=1 Tax=Salinicola peritrichatus TaxID=1267424 RepID=UPI003B835C2A